MPKYQTRLDEGFDPAELITKPSTRKCRRRAERKQVHLQGRVILNDGTSCSCIIQDTSSSGAKIVFETEQYVPPQFELEFIDQQTTITCRKAWQKDKAVGAHFISALIVQLNQPLS